ncbi:dioxygenase [Staphylococcus aureus]|uniref:Dioxygenase n=1 Tax=Staphylococcus aureus TaxID=1280 RepID=A0A380DX26_STAAU|nr:dioxygenase [Staphylococcus aureus]
MTNNHELLGIHHVTAMTDDAERNYKIFYRSIRNAFS